MTIFLLNLGVAPLYTEPRNPWNNGEVEGFNSIFATKFWNRTRFNNEEEVDVEIKKFNFEYEKYSDFVGNNPEIANPKFMRDFKMKELKNREVKRFRKKFYSQKCPWFMSSLTVKYREGEDVTDVKKRVVFGNEEEVLSALKLAGNSITLTRLT